MIILLIFGLAFLMISLIFLFKLKKISRNGIKTEGIVFDVEYRKNYRISYPVIRFLTVQNVWITQTPGFWTTAKVPIKGDKVSVIYNPDDPTDFVVEGKSNRVTPFILIGLSLIIIWGILKWVCKYTFIIVLFFYATTCFAQTDARQAEAQIRAAREASNKAIAAHDPAGIVQDMCATYSIVTGRGMHVDGRDSVAAFWKKTFISMPGVVYVRTPLQITISKNDSLAWESGQWKAMHSYSSGGNYSAMWHKEKNAWKIQAELFVSLEK
jgi:ketosteroid isomerase-like protein